MRPAACSRHAARLPRSTSEERAVLYVSIGSPQVIGQTTTNIHKVPALLSSARLSRRRNNSTRACRGAAGSRACAGYGRDAYCVRAARYCSAGRVRGHAERIERLRALSKRFRPFGKPAERVASVIDAMNRFGGKGFLRLLAERHDFAARELIL